LPPIRVLVVDDSSVVRQIVTEVLSQEPDLEVAGTAANGRIALDKVRRLRPDVVTLDVEMPELDGLATLKVIRREYPALPVIMFSTVTKRGAVATVDALGLGASDYATKPTNVADFHAALDHIRADLIGKIKALGARGGRVPRARRPRREKPAKQPAKGPADSLALSPAPSSPEVRVDAVVVGASTGGPNALAQLLRELPGDFPVPLLVVQHMPPLFTRYLANRLDTQNRVAVMEGEQARLIEPGTVWIAPGGRHMTVYRDSLATRISLSDDPPEGGCRPAVNALFRSAASVYGAGVLAVVLTGMGQDGMVGTEWVRKVGGAVLVQDPASSVVWSMPGAVAHAGLADAMLPLDDLAGEIRRRVCRERNPGMPHQTVTTVGC
jgi:two-component system chemotaxis response regulator CheB